MLSPSGRLIVIAVAGPVPRFRGTTYLTAPAMLSKLNQVLIRLLSAGTLPQGNGAYGVAVYACAGPTVNNVIISKNISESDRSGIWVSGKGDGVAQANNVIITDNLILSPTGSGG